MKNVEDVRLFLFCENIACYIWKKASKKSGFAKPDASTNGCMVHHHVLRKLDLKKQVQSLEKKLPSLERLIKKTLDET